MPFCNNPELILRVLQLRFDESLSYPRISAQTSVSKTAIFSLVRRFHQVFTDWPLSGEYSCGQLARALFPGRYPSTPTAAQPVKAEKPRRNRFSPEFKWRLVQQTLLPGACVAQIARENGINDNLLFNWRHLWRNGGLQPPGEHEPSLLPVTLTPEPDNKIPAPVQIPAMERFTLLAHENARLRALLQTQQDTIRQMAEYNRLLSQRVAAYASEINRLKALVAKLRCMQFGKSSEKLRAKTERQIQEAQERISALQEEMAEMLGELYDPALPSPLRQSSARKPLPASLPRETRIIRPEEECCPACGGELSSLGCDVSEQLELISSAFKVIETQRPKLACCRCDHIVQAPVPSKPIARSYAGAGLLAHVVAGKYADHLPLYRQSEIYRRQGVELSRATLGC